MQDFMRKHRKLILGFIILVIAVPFIFFFGMPTGQNNADGPQDREIMSIGGVPVTESEFRRNLDSAAQMMARNGQERPTYKELDESGMVKTIVDQLVDSSLISVQEGTRRFDVKESLLQEQFKKWDVFKDDKGNFNPAAYNEWVKQTNDWTALYDEIEKSMSRQVYLSMALAPSRRVLDSAIEEELIADNTKMSIKYVKIEPPVTPTEEEIQKQYNENQEKYRKPSTNVAEMVAFSLVPDVPQKALDAVNEARGGADFAEMVKKYSDVTVPEGGDLGWRAVEENAAAHIQPMFTLPVGQVSDPVAGPTGYFIYKVDEERVNDAGVREVHARQIVVNAALPEAKRAELDAKAAQLAAKARTTDLATAAAEAGLPVVRTGAFTTASMEIENVARADVPMFRGAMANQKDDKLFDPIPARQNIYVGRVVESVPGEIPPMEEVRPTVTNDVINATKRSDAYKKQVEDLSARIKKEAANIDEIPAKFPELQAEVKQTTAPFTRKDMLYQQQIFLQSSDIYDRLGKAEPGTMAGPLSGMLGDTWFVQLVEKTPPTDEEKANWAEERKTRREQAVRMGEYGFLSDYTKNLRERMLASVNFTQNNDAIDEILGRGKYAPEPEGEGEGEGGAAAPAAAPAAESAPAAAPAAEPAPAAAQQ